MNNIEIDQKKTHSKLFTVAFAGLAVLVVISLGVAWSSFREIEQLKQSVDTGDNEMKDRVLMANTPTYELGDINSPHVIGSILSIENDTILLETKVSIPNPFPKQGELPFSTGIKNVSVMINRDTIFTPNKEALIAGQSINVFTKEPKPENEAEVNALLITLFASPSERLIKSLDLYASSTIKNIKNKTSDNLQ
ncbi:MAG: hypothetical protein UU88_C0014G0002 [Parcubacteria group bacterium GW2011_GWC1_42_11]|uniref:Uncharacterized protein n=1 Tax=Candidatus Nomurabacteria bacterium GW2011_GWC2_42_20 TaxID=1618756 RepID=A0A0G0ZIB0_9BACT|nr:MAG: hypothetical protein UU88_C0014G0002 [Parcubacteria group bacterium GW2011_GWC1_42_11]KKS48419.1 MAG: hypothetical protein UV12_C0001G0114 [Candidatus Nomurabacteria bacterium GW2011_GWC2_42_20]KKS59426.1 MAG: hypothetical protein UV24_C0001G0014 [Candidatus Nomurabacteria bacterium GW2011_GWA2_42_41]KKT09993.1 MAG: hypothetical protein UV86_C0001G0095 [Candidatus Nomurabacteria bacterium GW2011_GWB1_43_20]TAN35856.1 MAG: hypothetical protein EPN27_03060 [Patescibacteria group bacterium